MTLGKELKNSLRFKSVLQYTHNGNAIVWYKHTQALFELLVRFKTFMFILNFRHAHLGSVSMRSKGATYLGCSASAFSSGLRLTSAPHIAPYE